LLRRVLPSLATIMVLAAGCTSRVARVAPPPPPSYRVLGTVHGGACGMMLFDVIPLHVNERVERAYGRALARARGATALIDTQLRDRWYTAGGIMIAGHIVCTDIVGTAIQDTSR